ncbi:MAG: class I SAM-dependent methyltransferase [Brasilonema sp.]
MGDCTVCNVCEQPRTFESAIEVNQIYSNLRKFQEQKFTVWRCSSCRSLHSKEEVDLDYYYEGYPVHEVLSKQELPSNYFLRYVPRRIQYSRFQLLKKQGFQKEHKLLDYGCADGALLSLLQEMGYKNVFGYDPYYPKYSDKKVLDERYDVIISQDVIEHVNEPREFLDQLLGSLKKDGLLVIGTPNADEIDLLNSKNSFMELHQPYHRHILSEEALLNLGASKGLEVLEVYKRCYADTLYPPVNTRFLWGYIRRAGMVMDIVFEPFRPELILTSPKLLFYAFAGYFLRQPGHMMIFFRRNR